MEREQERIQVPGSLVRCPWCKGDIEDVKQVNGQWYVAGTSGVVLVVCGVGQTLRQAQGQAYSRIRNIMIPDMYYRDDIGERWFEDHDKLHTWGYLREV